MYILSPITLGFILFKSMRFLLTTWILTTQGMRNSPTRCMPLDYDPNSSTSTGQVFPDAKNSFPKSLVGKQTTSQADGTSQGQGFPVIWPPLEFASKQVHWGSIIHFPDIPLDQGPIHSGLHSELLSMLSYCVSQRPLLICGEPMEGSSNQKHHPETPYWIQLQFSR